MAELNRQTNFTNIFLMTLATALSVSAYLYAAILPFRVVFLNDSIGPLLFWKVASPVGLYSIAIFLTLSLVIFSSCLVLQKRKKSLIPFASFWHLILTPLILSPLSARFPEFIPLAQVLLPVSSVSAFIVLMLRGRIMSSVETPGAEEKPATVTKGWDTCFKRRAPYLVWVVTFSILLVSGNHFNTIMGHTGGDEENYFAIARSIRDDHDIDLSNNIRKFAQKSQQGWHISAYSQGGHAYSWHPVGLPLLLALFQSHARFQEISLIVMCIIGAFLASQIYLGTLEETGSISLSIGVWLALSFSTPLWYYSFRVWPLMPAGLCMLFVWRRMRNFDDNKLYQNVILNILMAWLLWLHDSFIICYGILGIYLLCQWLKKLRDQGRFTSIILQAINVGLFLLFHYRWFGKNLFAQESELFAFWPGMLGTWFDFRFGMVFAGPIHLLCFILTFIYGFKKRDFSGFILLAVYLAAFVVETSGTYWTGGTCYPGRRLVPIIPLTCIPLGYFVKREKRLSFHWLVTFSSLLSVVYTLYFMIDPIELKFPLSSLALRNHRFRTIWLHLPGFGRNFVDFPWAHVLAVAIIFVVFVLLWTILLVKEKKQGKGSYLFIGTWLTLLSIFLAAGWMKTHFKTLRPIYWQPTSNCFGKYTKGVADTPFREGWYRYMFCTHAEKEGELSWNWTFKGTLPSHLDMSRGLHRFHIIGSGEPSSTVRIVIDELISRKKLSISEAVIDENGKFSHEVEVNVPKIRNRIRLTAGSESGRIELEEMTITPIPDGLESLMRKVQRAGEPVGWVCLGENG